MESTNLGLLNLQSPARVVENYLERFEIWCITKKDIKEKKAAYFLNFVGNDAYEVIKNLAYPESPINLPFEAIQQLILKHVQPINFEIAKKAKFHLLIREENQSIRDFILKLQTQAAKCNFGDQLQNQLRDRLIAGINDVQLQQKLFLVSDASFQAIRAICE